MGALVLRALGSWVVGFLSSWVHGFMGSWVLGFLGSWVVVVVVGVAVAVAGAANGVGADVRNTVGGAFDGGAVRRAGVVVTASATPSNLAARHKQGGCQQAGRSGVLHSHVLLFLLVQADACAPD